MFSTREIAKNDQKMVNIATFPSQFYHIVEKCRHDLVQTFHNYSATSGGRVYVVSSKSHVFYQRNIYNKYIALCYN